MKSTSDSMFSGSKVLYHAISSYQLLEIILHRQQFHSRDRAVLLLPDFIVKKYPQYAKLVPLGLFDEVYLFPYLQIPHGDEKQVMEDVVRCYRDTVPHAIAGFSSVYVAGAHFYFSLYLIQNNVPFVFLEDAAGMLSRPEDLEQALAVKFPLHAQLAGRYGLYDGSQPLARRILCLKSAQTKDVSGERYLNFSVEDALQELSPPNRRRVIRFFLRRRIVTRAQAVLLTQQFSNLGVMSERRQMELYEELRDGVLQGVRLVVKKHPDDTLDYRSIFPGAKIIRPVFPSELLPYVFWHKPPVLYAFDSTGCETLKNHFIIQKLGRVRHVE